MRTRRVLLAIISTLSIFLTGCGSAEVGEGEVPTEASSPETAATTATTAKPATAESTTAATTPETTTASTTPERTQQPTTPAGEDIAAFTATRTLTAGPVAGSPNFVFSVAFSPDGQLLASGNYDTTAKLWNPQSGELLRTLTGHSDSVTTVAFSPDGQLFASSGVRSGGMVKLCDPQSGKLFRTLTGRVAPRATVDRG